MLILPQKVYKLKAKNKDIWDLWVKNIQIIKEFQQI